MHNMGPRTVEKSKNVKVSFKRLGKYIKRHFVTIFFSILFSIVGVISLIFGPKYLGNMVEDFYLVSVSKEAYNDLLKNAYIAISLYSAALIFNYFSAFLMTSATQKISYELREEISKKINRIPLSYFDTHNFGDVLSRVTNDIDSISQNLNQVLSQVISAFIQFVGVLVMMLTISPIMTLIPVISIPVSMILLIIIIKLSQKFYVKQQVSLGELNSHIEEDYSGHNVIKAFNQEETEYKKFEVFNKSLEKSAWKGQFFSGMMMPILLFVGNLTYIAVICVGALRLLNANSISDYAILLADITMFINYSRLFTQPLQAIGQISNVLQSCAAASFRVFEFLDVEEMEKDIVTQKLSKDNVNGNVTFENVSFSYTKEKEIIHNFTCNIKAGQKIAIVGPTGAGKTTIVNLLMRFYEINSGKIMIDGINTKDMSKENVRELFAMVLQDTWLFEGSIYDNLVFGSNNATNDEINNALEACNISHFVNQLPNGIDHILDENANISSGQKQLLTIARAMIQKRPMLILDEATSSVDTRTELLIQKAMDNLMINKTSFVIAHRLSTIKNADLILVLKDGNIIEQGNHNELLMKKGFYYTLYNSQFDL